MEKEMDKETMQTMATMATNKETMATMATDKAMEKTMDNEQKEKILIQWTKKQKDKDLAHDAILKVLGNGMVFTDEMHLEKTLNLAKSQVARDNHKKANGLELTNLETEIDLVDTTKPGFILQRCLQALHRHQDKVLFMDKWINLKTHAEIAESQGTYATDIRRRIEKIFAKLTNLPVRDLYDARFIIQYGDNGISVDQCYPQTVTNPSAVKILPVEGYQPQQSTDCNRNRLKSLLRQTTGFCSFPAGGFNVKDIGNGFKQPVQVNSMVTRSFNVTQPMQDKKVDTLTVEVPIEKQITINRASYGQVEGFTFYQNNQKIIDRETGCMETGNHGAKRQWFIKGNSLLAN